MRLIDADELFVNLNGMMAVSPTGYIHGDTVADMISDAPTIEQPHWIPCSEKLPENSGIYLVSALDGIGRRTTVVPYQQNAKAWTLTGRRAYWRVTAWLPLPEPYKDGEE